MNASNPPAREDVRQASFGGHLSLIVDVDGSETEFSGQVEQQTNDEILFDDNGDRQLCVQLSSDPLELYEVRWNETAGDYDKDLVGTVSGIATAEKTTTENP